MRDLDSNLLNELVNTLNLPKEDILSHFVHDGQFNMLSGLVSYIHREQDGKGICAVSNQYSDEVQIFYISVSNEAPGPDQMIQLVWTLFLIQNSVLTGLVPSLAFNQLKI